MNESSPAPALQILFTDAEVFKPALIEKTEFAVRVRTVQKRRSSINDAPQKIFGGICWAKLTCIGSRRIDLVSGGRWQLICRTRGPSVKRDLWSWVLEEELNLSAWIVGYSEDI